MPHISGELIIDAAFTEVVGAAADERNEPRDSTGSSGGRAHPTVRSELEPASSPNPRARLGEPPWISRTQAATALTILMHHASHTVLDDELGEALTTRAVIDHALGILMVTRKISAPDAFDILRHTSQTTNRKISTIAAELIESMTGHPP